LVHQIPEQTFVFAKHCGDPADREDVGRRRHALPSTSSGRGVDRYRLPPIPWQQCCEVIVLVIGNPGQNIAKPRLRIDMIELRSLYRAPNYAERLWNDALSRRIYGPSSRHPPVPFGIV
jgi:hypothetical protein